MSDDEVLGWVRAAAAEVDARGDGDTVALDVREVFGVTSWFVIGSGATNRQVKAMAGHVEDAVADAGGPKPTAVEGLDTLEWVLMSYGDFVVHLFRRETRDFYELERLWRDVPTVTWPRAAAAGDDT